MDLDAYLLGGGTADQAAPAPTSNVPGTHRDVKPSKVRQTAPAAVDELAMARLRQLARGGGR